MYLGDFDNGGHINEDQTDFAGDIAHYTLSSGRDPEQDESFLFFFLNLSKLQLHIKFYWAKSRKLKKINNDRISITLFY